MSTRKPSGKRGSRVYIRVVTPETIEELAKFIAVAGKTYPGAELHFGNEGLFLIIRSKSECCVVSDAHGPAAVITRGRDGLVVDWADREIGAGDAKNISKTMGSMVRSPSFKKLDVAQLFHLSATHWYSPELCKKDGDLMETLMTRKEAVKTFLMGRSRKEPLVKRPKRSGKPR
jgi:hypothetical protein